jgi:hypothetical protein
VKLITALEFDCRNDWLSQSAISCELTHGDLADALPSANSPLNSDRY